MIQETILITLNPRHIKHFESLGYKIPRYIDKQNRLRFKKGTKIKVKVSDLPPKSNILVLCKCDMCGVENLVIYSNLKNYINPNYLCKKCSLNTEEHKKSISVRNTGKKFSDEHKRKISQNSWQTKHSGINSPYWNPKITDEERKNKRKSHWSISIKKRDNFICQCCGYVGKKWDGIMIAHHINNFNNFKELRIDVDNGITMCSDCHYILHLIFGPFTTVKDLEDFMTS